MNSGALRALEFDRIVDAVRSFALTPTGASALAVDLGRTPSRAGCRRRCGDDRNGTLPRRSAALPVAGARRPGGAARAAGRRSGRALEPARLLALADYLESIETARPRCAGARGNYPRLTSITGRVASFRDEIAAVRRASRSRTRSMDDASPALAGIRDRLRRQRGRLRGTLESYLRGKDTSKYLQEQVVTERNGRYVMLVKAEHRRRIPGLVHGSLRQRRDTVRRAARDRRSEQRGRRARGAGSRRGSSHSARADRRFRERAGDLRRKTGVATELDVLQAKARLHRRGRRRAHPRAGRPARCWSRPVTRC